MKNVKAPQYDDTIVIVKDGMGWELRYFNRAMGCFPLGPRLARGQEGLPDIPKTAETYSTAQALRDKWQEWLDKTQIISKRKGMRS